MYIYICTLFGRIPTLHVGESSNYLLFIKAFDIFINYVGTVIKKNNTNLTLFLKFYIVYVF